MRHEATVIRAGNTVGFVVGSRSEIVNYDSTCVCNHSCPHSARRKHHLDGAERKVFIIIIRVCDEKYGERR